MQSVADLTAAPVLMALLGPGALMCVAGAFVALLCRRRSGLPPHMSTGRTRAGKPHGNEPGPSPDRRRPPAVPEAFHAAVLFKPGPTPVRKGPGRRGRDRDREQRRRGDPGPDP